MSPDGWSSTDATELQNLHKYVMSSVGNQCDVFLCKYESLSILLKKKNKLSSPLTFSLKKRKKEKEEHALCVYPIHQILMEFFLQVLAKKFIISIVKYQRYGLYLRYNEFIKIDVIIRNIPKRLHSHICSTLKIQCISAET